MRSSLIRNPDGTACGYRQNLVGFSASRRAPACCPRSLERVRRVAGGITIANTGRVTSAMIAFVKTADHSVQRVFRNYFWPQPRARHLAGAKADRSR